MNEITTIGLDIAKHVFHAHGADVGGRTVFSRKITRGKLLDFFASQSRCIVALEACGGAHHWARELQAMGHEVRLIPPAYVKPFVKRYKKTMRWMPRRSARRRSGRAVSAVCRPPCAVAG
jgi:transposase